MINWKFDPSNIEEREFEPLPAGDYRVRIENVEEKSGQKPPYYPYYSITLKVSGDNRKLWYNLVFMSDPEKKKYTDTNLNNIWNSFDIPVGELDYNKWLGKVGAARVKHKFYNGEEKAEVSYFIKRENQSNLSPWQEEAPIGIDSDFTLMEEDDEIPF